MANTGSKTAYLKLTPDTTAVTIVNGIPLAPGNSIICDQDLQKELFDSGAYAIADGGTTTVAVQAF